MAEIDFDHLPCARHICQKEGRCRCGEFGIPRAVYAAGADHRTWGYWVQEPTGGWRYAGWKASRRSPRKKISKGLRAQVMQRDASRCVECGDANPVKLCLDHIVPVARGGKNTIDNLRVLCERCNLRKWCH